MRKRTAFNVVPACVIMLGAALLHPGPVAAQTPVPVGLPGSWNLTFQDEFNGTSLDPAKWRLGQNYAGILGVGATSPDRVSVANGIVRITGSSTPATFGTATRSYSTAELSTFRHFRQAYGYFEARIKHSDIKGAWPAFWLMPDRGNYGVTTSNYESYVKFDLTAASGLPATVTSAYLKLRVSSRRDTDIYPCFYKVQNDAWTETGINWSNRPKPDPLWLHAMYILGSSPTPAIGTEITIDVTQYVKSQVEGAGDKKISFAVADTYEKAQPIQFNTKESSSPPRLVINGISFNATADAQVKEGEPTANFGSLTTMYVQQTISGGNTSTFTNGMEVDIMETLGVWGPQNKHALHWDGYSNNPPDPTKDHEVTGSGSRPVNDDAFNVYGLYWSPTEMKFYINGVNTWTYNNSMDTSVTGGYYTGAGETFTGEVPSATAYMILSLQLGTWPGGGNEVSSTTVNNLFMEVDYVRAWSGVAGAVQPFSFECVTSAGTVSGGSQQQTTDSPASGGSVHVYYPSAIGNYVTFPVQVTTAGTYSISLRYKTGTNRGLQQLSIDTDGNTLGGQINQYSTSPAYITTTLGAKVLSAGTHTLKIKVMGTGAGGGAVLANDTLTFTPQ